MPGELRQRPGQPDETLVSLQCGRWAALHSLDPVEEVPHDTACAACWHAAITDTDPAVMVAAAKGYLATLAEIMIADGRS